MFRTKRILMGMMQLGFWVSVGFAALIYGASPASAATAPPLGTVESFAVLGGSTVTNTGSSIIDGNVGVSPGSAVTGFPPGIVNPPYAIHAADAVAAQAQLDLTTAYINLAGQACNTDLTGQDLGGMTLVPGTYCFSTAAQLTGTLTLDALGDSAAVFVFQIGSTLTTATGSSVLLTNGAVSRNVFWQVGTSATLGTTSTFAGNILALTSITLDTGADLSGRALARNGAVTLDGNNMSAPCPLITLTPPPLPQGTVGVAYSQTITANGGLGPYTFSLTAGTLPNGLLFNAGTGVISGTPTTANTSTFTVTATDANGCTGLQAYTIVINPAACPPITLTPPPLPPGIEGDAYSQTITANGGLGPYTFGMTAGTLPNGLLFNNGTGVISGTPTTDGTSTFTVTATDANGCTGLQAYTIVINPAACPPITLTPPPLPQGTEDVAYNQTITANGGFGPYTFGMTAGALPTGLSFTSSGLITGTPTTGGTSTFTVTATDANGCTGLQAYTIVINPAVCPPITLTPPPLPQGTVGVAYNRTITANGGFGPYTFLMTAGALPTGLSFTSNGLISGTPTTDGIFNFTATATDANGCTGLQVYTIVINPAACPPITLTPPPLPQGIAGVAYNQLITAAGGEAPYTFLMTTGALPTGLSFTNGLISGTPTTDGIFNFTVTATDANGCMGLQVYTIVINAAVCPPITLTPPPLPQGIAGETYNQLITAAGGEAPYTFLMTAGVIPTGLSFTSDGLISGRLTSAGAFTFTITATDSNGCTGLQAYTIVINADYFCPPITLTQPPLPPGTEGDAYSQIITARGGSGPYTFRMTDGTLPAGLSFTNGLISGTPTTDGTFTFTVMATDSNGCVGLQAYTIVINTPDCPPITLTPPPLPQGTVGVAYNRTITAAGGEAPYTYSITAGALPTGLSFTNGLISGTPTALGTFTFTVTATDANNCTGLQAYTIVIIAGSASTEGIPTLSEWGMIIFMALMALMSIYYLRRQEL